MLVSSKAFFRFKSIPRIASMSTITPTLNVSVFSAKPYDEKYLNLANQKSNHKLHYHVEPLTAKTAHIAKDCEVVCSFVNDILDKDCLKILHQGGTRHVALRCAGFDSVDLKAAEELNIAVARVPAYSPYAVAEHAIALLLTVNRYTHKGYNRVREGNFALNGLLGFDLYGKTVGIVGTGNEVIILNLISKFL